MGNPLTLEQVRAVEEGREISAVAARAKREVINYFAALRFTAENVTRRLFHTRTFSGCTRSIAGEVMDQDKNMTPPEIWAAFDVTKQGTMKLMQPLLELV